MKLTRIGIGAVVLASILAGQVFCRAQDAGSAAEGANISAATADVVKLSQSGVGDGVVLPFVQNTQSPFNLSADDMVYLRDIGVSEDVITAMINHDHGAPGQPAQPSNNQAILAQATAAQAQVSEATGSYSSDAPEDATYYYDDLSPYGSWVDLDGYGWCWQPTALAVNPNWQPYRDAGYWVYTDSGWFWQSDYTWGWAPFHYGRWFHHERNGWVWFPDRVWGPAWVTWRTVDNDCGWAPLPLHTVLEADGFVYNGVRVGANFDFGLPQSCFTFVGLADFCKPELTHLCLPQPEVARIYGRTTIINNYEISKNVVVNHGIAVNRVSAATHLAIKPLAIRDVPAGGGKPAEESGVVYRRTPQAPSRPVQVRAQKVDEQHPVVAHTFVPPANANRRTMIPQEPAKTVEKPVEKPAERVVEQPIQNTPQPMRATQPNKSGPPVQISEHDKAIVDSEAAAQTSVPKANPPAPRSQRVAEQAHALPPLNEPHDAPTPLPATTAPKFEPRSEHVAEQAHALPALKEPPPAQTLAKPAPANNPDTVSSPRDKTRQQH
jgi:hypothetical protein